MKCHINHLFAKIDARDRARAVSFAYRHGLVPLVDDAPLGQRGQW